MPENIEERTRRLLLLLQAMRPNTRTPLSEFALLTGTPQDELVSDLQLLSMCAADQRDPTSFIPVLIDNDHVEVFGHLPALDKPVRFSISEARAVIAAMRVAGVPADSELHRKISLAAGSPGIAPEEIERRLHASSSLISVSPYLNSLAFAAKHRRVVHMAYRRASSLSATDKNVEPLALMHEKDVWYVFAYCQSSLEVKTYRLDRIESLEVTEASFEPRAFDLPSSALPLEELPAARVRFGPDEKIAEREWPGIRIVTTEKDGSRIAEIPYAGSSWLAQRIVACLGGAEALSPSELREAVADLAGELIGGNDPDLADGQH